MGLFDFMNPERRAERKVEKTARKHLTRIYKLYRNVDERTLKSELFAAIRDPDLEVRKWNAYFLRYFGDANAVEVLLEAAFKDTDTDVRRIATDSIGTIALGNRHIYGGEKYRATEEAKDLNVVYGLIQILEGSDDTCLRCSAARSLGDIERAEAILSLQRASGDSDPNVSFDAACSLRRIGLSLHCEECGQSYTLGKDAVVVTTLGTMRRFAAVSVLGDGSSFVDNQKDPDLIALLEGPYSSLDRKTHRDQEAEIAMIFRQLYTHRPRWWKCKKCSKVQKYSIPESAEPNRKPGAESCPPGLASLVNLLEEYGFRNDVLDLDPYEAALERIKDYGEAAIPLLTDRLGKSKYIAFALGLLGTDAAVSTLAKELGSRDWRRVEAAAIGLGLTKNPKAKDHVQSLLGSRLDREVAEVHSALARAMSQLYTPPPEQQKEDTPVVDRQYVWQQIQAIPDKPGTIQERKRALALTRAIIKELPQLDVSVPGRDYTPEDAKSRAWSCLGSTIYYLLNPDSFTFDKPCEEARYCFEQGLALQPQEETYAMCVRLLKSLETQE